MTMRILLLAAAVACACAYDHDTQAVKSVKGGHGGFHYQGGDISRFYNNSTQHGVYNSTYGVQRPSQGSHINFEVGVCYIEVPTANLVRDKLHIPAGNGSRPDLSRIRTCCTGYQRNVYNFKICEPVCKQECVNALCTAPDTCTCYPDHVRNLAGVCVATCPIGCQNGVCDGGECMCRDGFRLHADGKFCVPVCRDNCGGIGNCTAPNSCSCSNGYQPSADGSCRPAGAASCGNCENGDCVSASECRCRSGFTKDSRGLCVPHCNPACLQNERCTAPNVCSVPSVQGRTNNTFYYNPSQGSNYPLYPYNQNGPQQNPYGTQGTGYPHTNATHQQGLNQPNHYPGQNAPGYSGIIQQQPYYPYPNSPQQGSNYPPTNPNQPHQGTNYPQTNPNQSQGSNYPQPNPIYQNQSSNYPQYPYGQNPQNNTFNQGNSQYPNQPNQGPYPQTGQAVIINYPQNPLQPNNQIGSNQTNYPSNYPGYPDNHRPGSYNPQYPTQGSNQPNYPTYQGGYYNQVYPYNQGSQYPYDQTQQSSQCSEPCVNGVCIGHNQCRCNPGYVTDEMDPTGNKCRPHCPGGCPNGYCAGPYSCACDEGYYRDTSVKGRPACVRRIRRSLQQLIFSIPDYADQ